MAKWLRNAEGKRLRAGLLVGSDHITQLETDVSKTIPLSGINDFAKQLDRLPVYWERLHLTPNYFRQNWRWDLRKYHFICNMVTDPDHNTKTLKVAERLLEKPLGPVINAPKLIPQTARDSLPDALEGIPGIIMPRTIRLRNATPERLVNRTTREGLRWPLLVKEPGLHSGRFVGLFKSAKSFEPHLDDGRKEFLLTEFANFKSPDGLYRKCRFWFIGRKILLRHHVTDERWNLHGHNRKKLMMGRPELRHEEEALLERQLSGFPPRTTDVLEGIRERIGLDYFGVDCHVRPNGELLIFEANATMNYGSLHEDAPEYDYIDRILDPMVKEAVLDLIAEKLLLPREVLSANKPRMAS